MFLEREALVFLVGVAVSTKADSVIIWNGCKDDGKPCSIAMKTLAGRDEHDCRVFSSAGRTCSTKQDQGMDEESDIAVTTIYNKDGDVILKWHGSTVFFETQSLPPTIAYHHIVPEEEWDLQPIFWKRRKRQVKKFRGKLVTCNCTVKGEKIMGKRNESKQRQNTKAAQHQPSHDGKKSSRAGCINGFRARYGVSSRSLTIGHIIKRITTESPSQCAHMCENEFVTQIDCVAIAFSDRKTPNCILLSSLPKRTIKATDYMIYTKC
uniref:Apple domain-containing protein n=1 Tax=Haemonchus contortus TaxID=6289 RepID=A0A7I4YCF3_HAECO|nr:unnamed protein product [Haemonchus contortus]